MDEHTLAKMHKCADLLEAPAPEVVRDLIAEVRRLQSLLHDAERTPLAEVATELAAARENVAGTAALLAEANAEVERLKRRETTAAALLAEALVEDGAYGNPGEPRRLIDKVLRALPDE